MMTDEDARMLDYFWNEKGDLERWSNWHARREAIRESHPEIIKAWEDYKVARRMLSVVIKAADA